MKKNPNSTGISRHWFQHGPRLTVEPGQFNGNCRRRRTTSNWWPPDSTNRLRQAPQWRLMGCKGQQRKADATTSGQSNGETTAALRSVRRDKKSFKARTIKKKERLFNQALIRLIDPSKSVSRATNIRMMLFDESTESLLDRLLAGT